MRFIAYTLSLLLLLVSVEGQYEKLFTSGPAFWAYPYPTISIECHEIGPSGSTLDIDHTYGGAGYFPALSWPSATRDIREYLIVSEDPDAPFPHSVIHGIYYGVPRVFTGLEHSDFQVNEQHPDPHMLRGWFKYGQNRRSTVYLPPRHIPGQGGHRYYFELIALNQPIDQSKLSSPATLEEIAHEIEGKVVGWGAWVGIMEN